MTFDSVQSDSTAARYWYSWHGAVSQPNYRVLEYFKRYGNPADPKVFDNCSTKAREYAYRAFGPAALVGVAAFLAKNTTLPQIGLIAAGLVALEVGRTALHLLGYFAQKKNYIHVRGDAADIHIPKPKIMSWNILGFPAGMNYTCGGCIPFRDRFPGIVKQIRSENPDIVILQECWMDSSFTEMVVKEFKKDYAHFFIHNGPSPLLGIESGLIVMTKSYVTGYTFTPFDTNTPSVIRGFATLTVPASNEGRPAFAVIGTHMEAGYAPKDTEKRKQQLAQIHAHAKSLHSVTTVILAGDLNMDAAQQKERDALGPVLDGIYAPQPNGLETFTNELNMIRYPDDKNPPREWDDQISVIRRSRAPERALTEFKVIPAYQSVNGKIDSKTALSDHNALVATFQ